MRIRLWVSGSVASIVVGASICCSQGIPGEQQTGRADRDQLPQPVYKVANKTAEPTDAGNALAPAGPSIGAPGTAPTQHPLAPAIQMAKDSLAHIQRDVQDYTCTMVKQENIGGKLQDPESMYVKVRHQPFSVYMRFLSPKRIEGQEAIYVAGQNDGLMLAHGVGLRKMIGTVRLDPTGALAMSGQRYPITELGFENLTRRLIEVAEKDSKHGECEVKFFRNAKLNGRLCTGIQVTHPQPRPYFLFNVATILVDDELNIPVRYEAKVWPTRAGGQPELLESYTYLDIKINQGLTNADFDIKNPNYGF